MYLYYYMSDNNNMLDLDYDGDSDTELKQSDKKFITVCNSLHSTINEIEKLTNELIRMISKFQNIQYKMEALQSDLIKDQ